MTLLLRSAVLRDLESAHADQPLMSRAGAAAAEWAETLAADASRPILVLAGPGNNGGDAFVTARHLRQQGADVRVVFVADPQTLPPAARAAREAFLAAGGTTVAGIPDGERWGLVIDGLFGIGLTRSPESPYADWIPVANALAGRDGCPLLALDCPSGLNADTGRAHHPTIRASHTLSFIADKPGLHTADGPDQCGLIRIASLGLDLSVATPPAGHLVTPTLFAEALVARLRNTHKGSFGSAGIVGGAHSMLGASLLAGRAALRLGAGRVYVGLVDPEAPSFDPACPELMLRRPEGVLEAGLTALACGPGLGNSLTAISLLERALGLDLPIILDADALNLIAFESALQSAVAQRTAPTLLTPHPLEAARLMDCEPEEVQADRIGIATELAWRFDAQVALKGCGTVIASPKGQWWINSTGNPGLASAGTGDVLTGFTLALLAQGWTPENALLAAVHLHGAAADALVESGSGPVGLTASELVDPGRRILNRWLRGG
jgi:hydroxyethylthiazole kinase-like uncharacterized protein yjeF